MSRWPAQLPHPALVFVVFAWGFNFAILKLTYEEMPVEVVMLLRYLGMGIVLWLYAKSMKLTYKPTQSEVSKFLFAGFMSTGLYMVLFLEGMSKVGAAQGAVCLATAPIWVSIFSVISGHDRGRWQLFVGGCLAYFGVAAVILMGRGERHWTPLGLTLMLLSALVWAISVVMMKPLLKDRPAVGVYVATYPGAALILVPYGIRKVLEFDYSKVSWVGWSGLSYLIFIAGFGAFTAYYVGVREVGASKTSMIAYFVPVVAAFAAWGLRGESLNLPQGIGIMVVLLGVWLASALPTRKIVQAVAGPDRIG
ncbi:MAG: DMT family transporter [Fimbriimonadaceae bacterium]